MACPTSRFQASGKLSISSQIAPPENALVIGVDKKSQIQDLQHNQPIMPLRTGNIERDTPEYFRNGILSLFAELDVKKDQVLGNCYQRHRP